MKASRVNIPIGQNRKVHTMAGAPQGVVPSSINTKQHSNKEVYAQPHSTH
jgi:hypothetical protein